jgi:hypothetical protein
MTFNARHECVDVRDKTGDQLIPALLSSLHARDFAPAIQGVLTRAEYWLNAAGFRYARPDLLDPDEATWDGVKVTLLDEEKVVDERTFAQLVLITAQAFIAGMELTKHPMLREPWWPELLHATSRLEAQVAAMEDQERLGA